MTPAKPAAELAARRQLAERLRALRVGAGLSTTQLANQLGWSQAKVSRIETATHGVAPGDVRTWAETLDVPAALVEQLVERAWAASTEVRSFRREMAAGYASKQTEAGEREAQATLLRSLQHLVVPALFQIRPYAVALFQRARPIARDAEQAADARLGRQRILDDQTRQFQWVVTEAALWWRPADWAVQAEQIRAVTAATSRPNVDLRVLPLDAQAPTFYHSFTILDEHLVVADGLGGIRLHDPDDIAWQIEVFTRMQQAALDPAASRAVLDGLAARFAAR
ncbi:MAG: helix-turn-helix domain-containing protein [Pseudonocardiaceae bacterium]